MANDIRHRQSHIEFLENYINEITAKIDELTGGRDIEKMIESFEYRLHVLRQANGKFPSRIKELEEELKNLRDDWSKLGPVVKQLEEERSFYRCLQSEL